MENRFYSYPPVSRTKKYIINGENRQKLFVYFSLLVFYSITQKNCSTLPTHPLCGVFFRLQFRNYSQVLYDMLSIELNVFGSIFEYLFSKSTNNYFKLLLTLKQDSLR